MATATSTGVSSDDGGASGDGDVSGDGDSTDEVFGCPDGECTIDTTGLTCYKFTAHAQGDYKAKFKVGAATDDYYNFHFAAPWTGTVYGIVIRPIIDNKKVIHHWLMFQQPGGVDVTPGKVVGSMGTHPTGDLVQGWAPGGGVLDFRKLNDNVGFEFKQGDGFIMEFHYNSSDANALDASGVEVCVQTKKPTYVAGVSWLGSDAIVGAKTQGTCDPTSTEPIHVIAVSPHMHLKGKYMKSVLNRAGGTSEIFHEGAFDFQNQVGYKANFTIMPGDTITTRCDYTSSATFGTATTNEMCYLFTTAYPKGALSNGDRALHGGGSCLGPATEGGLCGQFGQCIK